MFYQLTFKTCPSWPRIPVTFWYFKADMFKEFLETLKDNWNRKITGNPLNNYGPYFIYHFEWLEWLDLKLKLVWLNNIAKCVLEVPSDKDHWSNTSIWWSHKIQLKYQQGKKMITEKRCFPGCLKRFSGTVNSKAFKLILLSISLKF